MFAHRNDTEFLFKIGYSVPKVHVMSSMDFLYNEANGLFAINITLFVHMGQCKKEASCDCKINSLGFKQTDTHVFSRQS